MSKCPNNGLLQKFMDGELAPCEFDAVDSHVGSCPKCQQELNRICELAPQADRNTSNGSVDQIEVPVPIEVVDRWAKKVESNRDRFADERVPNQKNANQPPFSRVAPTQLGDFRIIREIGRGGMGIVYEAEQMTLGRTVALKILPHNIFQTNNSAKRFQREAAAAASLHHTNIVPVYDAGQENGIFYFAMQLIDGCALDVVRETIKKSRSQAAVATDAKAGRHVSTDVDCPTELAPEAPAPAGLFSDGNSDVETKHLALKAIAPDSDYYQFVAKVGSQVASALQHAHERGIIHRDVKPSNLILDANGIVWLADFGLAKQLDDGMTITADVPGTLRYMSPERFKGQFDSVSDVYSLGVSLYELVTLEPVFSATDQMSLLNQIKNVAPRLPQTLDRQIPLDLQTIILKAMAKEPTRRYPNAAELKHDLDRFLNGLPILARKVSARERIWLWAKNRKALAASLAALTILVVATAVGSTIAAFHFRHQERIQSRLATEKTNLAAEKHEESVEARTQRDAAFQNAYFADMRQAHQDWKNGDIRRTLTTLERYVPVLPMQDVRSWEWYYLLSLANQEQRSFLDHDDAVKQLAWSPDGSRLFSFAANGELKIRDQDGVLISNFSIPGISGFALNPEATQVVTISDDSIVRIWDTETAELKSTFPFSISLKSVDWNHAGDKIAIGQANGVQIIDVATGNVSPPLNDDSLRSIGYQLVAKFSPDDKFLLVCGNIYAHIWDMERNKFVNQIAIFLFKGRCADWHLDSRRFVIGTELNGGWLFEINDDSNAANVLGQFDKSASIRSIKYSSDASSILVGNDARTVDIYDSATLERTNLLRGHLGSINSVDWKPDQKTVVSGSEDGVIKLWDLEKLKLVGRSSFQYSNEMVRKSGTSPDGKWQWSSKEGMISVTERETGRTLASFEDHDQRIEFFPDSNLVLALSDSSALVWNTETWQKNEELCFPGAIGARIKCLDFKNSVLCGTDQYGLVKIVNFKTQKVSRILAHFRMGEGVIQLNHDGSQLATAVFGEVAVWDTATGEKRHDFFGHQPEGYIRTLTWDNKGRFIATGSADLTIRIWDTQLGKLHKTLKGHQSTPKEILFSNDDSRLASEAKSLRVWDVQSGREVVSFDEGTMFPTQQEFLESAEKIASRIPTTALKFQNLAKANRIGDRKKEVEEFRPWALNASALAILIDPAANEFDAQRGIKQASAATSLAPTDDSFRLTLALGQFRSKHYASALDNIKLVDKTDPRNGGFCGLLESLCLWETSNENEAKAAYSASLAIIENLERIPPELQILVNETAEKLLQPKDAPGTQVRTLVVNTLNDEADCDENGNLSLREAVLRANPGDKILIDVKGILKLRFGPIQIDRSLTISGSGPSDVVISAATLSRIINIGRRLNKPTPKVSISRICFRGGLPDKSLARVPHVCGGAIFANGDLDLTDCEFDSNWAHRGGAVWVEPGTIAHFKRCSFHHNRSGIGGAILVGGGVYGAAASVVIEECDFHQNVSQNNGSAIHSFGKLKFLNSTFSRNKGNLKEKPGMDGYCIVAAGVESILDHCTIFECSGGGIGTFSFGTELETSDKRISISNSIVDSNKNDAGESFDIFLHGKIHCELEHSIFGKINREEFEGVSNLQRVDPKLGPLANNGGPTKTHALLDGSPAIDAGKFIDRQPTLEFDQRGTPFKRSLDGDEDGTATPDIGSFELQK